MRQIHLHGALADEFGANISLDVKTVTEAVQALCVVLPGFKARISSGVWNVVVGKSVDTGISLDEDEIAGFKVGNNDIHFIPALVGAKRGGILKAVLGVALIGLSFGFAGVGFMGTAVSSSLLGATTWGNAIGAIGLAMASNGISSLLAPEADDGNDSSYLMNGPTMSGSEGDIVPIPYGRVITGGVPISGQIDIEQIKI